MNKKEANALVCKAEDEIAQILKRVELETNLFVDEVDLRKENIATHLDETPHYVRHVALVMCYPPGSNWR